MILLDTHALIWWADGDPKLSATAMHAIDHARRTSKVAISSLTCWEIALLKSLGRIRLSADLHTWIAAIEALRQVTFIPVDNHIAVTSVELPGTFHKDPADRIIVATAITLGVPLLTADRQIQAYPYIATVW